MQPRKGKKDKKEIRGVVKPMEMDGRASEEAHFHTEFQIGSRGTEHRVLEGSSADATHISRGGEK